MVNFSEHEKMVLKILGRRKMTIHSISEEFYNSLHVPLAERNYVATILKRIEAKCEKERNDWTILGEGSGRGGRTVWKGKRKCINQR